MAIQLEQYKQIVGDLYLTVWELKKDNELITQANAKLANELIEKNALIEQLQKQKELKCEQLKLDLCRGE